MAELNKPWKCCICGCYYEGWGNNPSPVSNSEYARCCDLCNTTVVIPARLKLLRERGKDENKD